LRSPELTPDGRLLGGVLLAFFVVAVLAALDLGSDLQEGAAFGHVAIEGGITVVGLLGSLVIARRLVIVVRQGRAAQEEASTLAERLKATEAEAERWRAEARGLLQGLGAALDQQFERWALSPAEKEVALLLLKGSATPTTSNRTTAQ
jgi:hypothetical protein